MKVITNNLIAYDAEWQYPAITEKYAFQKMKELMPKINNNNNIVYFGFPWATLIDLLNKGDGSGENLLKIIKFFKCQLKGKKVVTVCQHIHLLNFEYLFKDAMISEVFWSHAAKGQLKFPNNSNINIHPFPLYPVQVINLEKKVTHTPPKYLFSFVGAKADHWYLTDSRNIIINLFQGRPGAKVIGRDSWHYKKIVYDYQIAKNKNNSDTLVSEKFTAQYKEILQNSIFSLCPSGSGPNSIRLWESIGCGVIPVVLSDTYLPPGNQDLWNSAVVFCKEDEMSISELPRILKDMSENENLLKNKRNALKQLWEIYGPNFFVYDLLKFFISFYKETSYENLTHDLSQLVESKNKNKVFLLACISRLLLEEKKFLEEVNSDLSVSRSVVECLNMSNSEAGALRRVLERKLIVFDGKNFVANS